ncbi:alpha/beta fold hydrolase [Sphingomonas sp. MMS24-JH45]
MASMCKSPSTRIIISAHHLPLAREVWGDAVTGASVHYALAGLAGDPPFAAIAQIDFASMEAFQQAMAHPRSAEVQADVANFAGVVPQVQLSPEGGMIQLVARTRQRHRIREVAANGLHLRGRGGGGGRSSGVVPARLSGAELQLAPPDAFARGEGLSRRAPNQRGYGATTRPARVEDYTADRIVADAAALFDASGASKLTLVAHDSGGAIAWLFAINRVRPVERLVVMNLPHPRCFAAALKQWPQRKRAVRRLLPAAVAARAGGCWRRAPRGSSCVPGYGHRQVAFPRRGARRLCRRRAASGRARRWSTGIAPPRGIARGWR